jgi:hypothetical protein
MSTQRSLPIVQYRSTDARLPWICIPNVSTAISREPVCVEDGDSKDLWGVSNTTCIYKMPTPRNLFHTEECVLRGNLPLSPYTTCGCVETYQVFYPSKLGTHQIIFHILIKTLFVLIKLSCILHLTNLDFNARTTPCLFLSSPQHTSSPLGNLTQTTLSGGLQQLFYACNVSKTVSCLRERKRDSRGCR